MKISHFISEKILQWLLLNRLVWIAGLALLLLSLLRTAIHVDEARYLTVAWEMFSSGNYMVPHLNGEPYSHKPPLLFWLTNLVWNITGVHLWSARIIPIIFILLTALILPRLYTSMNSNHRANSPFILQGFFLANFLILGISQLFMFDTMMMFWVTLGWLILLKLSDFRQSILLGIVMGLAILTKGPVIFLYLLPICLILWMMNPTTRQWRWGGQIILAIGIGSTIGLTWALLAADQGGDDYATALLWKQSANRLINSPYHQRSWWFYFLFLPVFLIPGGFLINHKGEKFKLLWKTSVHFRGIILWIASMFVIFSFISCKQLQYLTPLVPMVSILMAWMYQQDNGRPLSTPVLRLMGYSYFLLAIVIYPLNQQMEKRLPLIALSQNLLPFSDKPVALVHTLYHGELGFPARCINVKHLKKMDDLEDWFGENPDGIAVIFDCPRFFPGTYKFNWFTSLPYGWGYMTELTRFYENYTVIARNEGKHADKIVLRKTAPFTTILHYGAG